MDDGKPTRAKWWSRPRPQASPGRQSPADPVDDTTAEPAPEEAIGREPSTGTENEGDFELARPTRPTPTTDDGDYELSRPAEDPTPPIPTPATPVAPAAPAALTPPAPAAAPEAPTPATPSTASAVPAPSAAPEAPGTPAVLAAPAEQTGSEAPVGQADAVVSAEVAPAEPLSVADERPTPPVSSAVPAAPAALAEQTGSEAPVGQADDVVSAEVAPAEPLSVADERPKPLHDPDPYSTPPYGEPGPWAPAPPVQHPAATSTPAPAAHGPVPATPAPATVPAPVESAGPGTAAAPAAPAGPVAQAVPAVPAAPVAQAASAAQAPPGAPGAPGAPGGQASVADSVAALPADPWQRYDPWSASPVVGATAAGGSRRGAIGGGALQYAGADGLASYAGTGILTEAQQRRQARRWLVGGALLVALVAGGLGGAVGVYLERNGGLNPVELPQAAAEPTGRAADSVAGIAARALPGVVTLHVSGSEESATGTGFVLDSLGYILTNNHVVEPAGDDGGITVVFNGGQTAEAEVVGRDSGYDLAVVRVTGVKGLKPLYLGNSDNVRVGDPVVAIGAPFDLEGTVTSGIISAKERPITAGGESGDGSDVSYVDALQTDAPINPGNSGGPLLDAQGHVIGINSAIRSAADGTDSGSAQAGSIGLGFAIPVNQGKRVAEELINTGRATHPVIGVTLDMDYAGDGARVGTADSAAGSPVTAGGPADRAGVRAGDVITEIDGRRVHSGEELIVKTRAHRPGDRLALTIQRDGQERTLTLVLGSSGGG
ncbi:trypsin-like peptidase domain-containing protein [Streptomyces cacaoi]|uniref:S1C family serine protease n=1 Tax=Streptomyces cacaoi TaxID=1898 RepID=UPI00374A2E0E